MPNITPSQKGGTSADCSDLLAQKKRNIYLAIARNSNGKGGNTQQSNKQLGYDNGFMELRSMRGLDMYSLQTVQTIEALKQWIVTTLAGDGTRGFQDGAGTVAQFVYPQGVAVDSAGNVYVADTGNHRIRMITPTGVVTTLAGDGSSGSTNGPGTSAKFDSPQGIVVDSSGYVYVADIANQRIRNITPAGFVSTLAGDGTYGFQDGAGTVAQFRSSSGLAVDLLGNVYVADSGNNRIRKITPAGAVSTFAGDGTQGFLDGAGIVAQFNSPYGVAVDSAGYVYVADTYSNRIRKIRPDGFVTTLAGDGTQGYLDKIGTLAKFYNPRGVAVDSAGYVYVADGGNNRIRKITPAGVVSTLAGDGSFGFLDGTGTVAQFKYPTGVAVDSAGNVYVADNNNQRIRKITYT